MNLCLFVPMANGEHENLLHFRCFTLSISAIFIGNRFLLMVLIEYVCFSYVYIVIWKFDFAMGCWSLWMTNYAQVNGQTLIT